MKAGGTEDEVDKAVIELELAAVAVESCLGGTDEDLLGRHLSLAVYNNGAVHYTRS